MSKDEALEADALAAAKKMKQPGLRLTLPGAPNTPHFIPGVAGLYRPDIPTPVGGPGELPLPAAVAAALDDRLALELVDIPRKDVDTARAVVADDIAQARSAEGAANRTAVDTERDHIEAHHDAVAGA